MKNPRLLLIPLLYLWLWSIIINNLTLVSVLQLLQHLFMQQLSQNTKCKYSQFGVFIITSYYRNGHSSILGFYMLVLTFKDTKRETIFFPWGKRKSEKCLGALSPLKIYKFHGVIMWLIPIILHKEVVQFTLKLRQRNSLKYHTTLELNKTLKNKTKTVHTFFLWKKNSQLDVPQYKSFTLSLILETYVNHNIQIIQHK